MLVLLFNSLFYLFSVSIYPSIFDIFSLRVPFKFFISYLKLNVLRVASCYYQAFFRNLSFLFCIPRVSHLGYLGKFSIAALATLEMSYPYMLPDLPLQFLKTSFVILTVSACDDPTLIHILSVIALSAHQTLDKILQQTGLLCYFSHFLRDLDANIVFLKHLASFVEDSANQ